jgi:hypothetical protein
MPYPGLLVPKRMPYPGLGWHSLQLLTVNVPDHGGSSCVPCLRSTVLQGQNFWLCLLYWQQREPHAVWFEHLCKQM